MGNLRRPAAALAALLLVLPALAACGEDDDTASHTTHTTTSLPADPSAPAEPEVDPEVLETIQGRGTPSPTPVEGEVTELEIIDDVEGTGDEVTEGATVKAHYVGIVAESGEQFDSSWERGEPLTFSLGGVIQGWSEGLVGMKVGGRRTLVIPAEKAYADAPPQGSNIPPGAALVFTVDLAAVA
jgi:peptidylprolyl isomerase